MNEEFGRCMADIIKQMSEKTPALAKVLKQAKEHKWSERETMQELMRLVQTDPSLSDRFIQLFREATVPLREPKSSPPDGLFQGESSKRWKLNPLYEAALIERIQYDEDIPEFRTGPLPPGTKPAVPIKTNARNPVALGRMLDNASRNMQRRIEAHEVQRIRRIDAVAAGQADSKALQRLQEHSEIIKRDQDGNVQLDILKRGSADTDHPSYRRGQVPKPMAVRRPKGSYLALMGTDAQQKNAWKFLSTTQGRRSAVKTIRGIIVEQLANQDIHVVEQDYDKDADVDILAHHKWEILLDGQGNLQPAFSLVDTAAKVLASGLVRDLVGNRPQSMKLEVVPVNALADRRVGWEARLVAPPIKRIE